VKGPRLTVVVPARDEAETIGTTLDGLARALAGIEHEIIVVDDHSRDGTVEAARQRGDPRVRVIPNDGDGGFGNTVRLGFRHARGEAVVTVMADGCDEAETIPRMLAEIDRSADVVAGSRYMPGGRKVGGPLVQTLLSRGLGLLLHAAAGLPIRDVSNAFKMYRRSVLDAIRPEGDGFALSMEMTVKAHGLGFRVTEVPTTWTERRAGRSKFRPLQVYRTYLGWMLWAVGYALARRR
jgi:glycosyltransferase involved in cell wall biosynthesis